MKFMLIFVHLFINKHRIHIDNVLFYVHLHFCVSRWFCSQIPSPHIPFSPIFPPPIFPPRSGSQSNILGGDFVLAGGPFPNVIHSSFFLNFIFSCVLYQFFFYISVHYYASTILLLFSFGGVVAIAQFVVSLLWKSMFSLFIELYFFFLIWFEAVQLWKLWP